MTEEQFKQLMAKLDKIIGLLEAQQQLPVEVVPFKYIQGEVIPDPFESNSLPPYVYPIEFGGAV